MQFGHEDLEVWNRAVDFAVFVIDKVENIDRGRKHYRLLEQNSRFSEEKSGYQMKHIHK